MRTLTIDPLIPSALWVALALAAGVLVVLYAWRRPPGIPRVRWGALIGGMSIAVVCVLIVLLNPMWIEVIAPPGGRPRITVLCDASTSMATPDAQDGSQRHTRYAAAAKI